MSNGLQLLVAIPVTGMMVMITLGVVKIIDYFRS